MRPRAADAAALLVTLLVAALFVWVGYLAHSGVILLRLGPLAAPGDARIFAGWTLAILLGTSLVVFLGTVLFGRVGRVLAICAIGLWLPACYLDDRLYALFGVHLYGDAVTRFLGGRGFNDVIHATFGEIAFVAGAVAGVSALAWALLAWLRRRLVGSGARLLVVGLTAALLAISIGLVLARPALRVDTRLSPILPLHGLFLRAPAVDEALRIYYPKSTTPPTTFAHRPNVVLTLVESLRADALTPELMPEVSRRAAALRCDRSLHHYAGSHSTDFSFFSVLYGLHAFQYLPFAQRDTASYPLQVLHDAGYAIVGAASSNLEEWGELKHVLGQFDLFQHIDGKGPAERDRAMLDWAEAWRKQHGSEKPYFMLLFFDSTHHKYFAPPAFQRFQPALPDDHNLITGKVEDPATRLAFQNRYRNAVAYVDSLLGELLASTQDDPSTIWIMAGDHGEEFWDRGLLGHAAPHLVNARTQVPLLLCASDRQGRVLPRSSNTDLMATILDALGASPPLDEARYTNGHSLFANDDSARVLVITAAGFPFTARTLQLISTDRKYLVEKRSDGDRDFQVVGTTDLDDNPSPPPPGEVERVLAALRSSYRYFYKPDGR